jgi:hypothetical protein
MLKDCIGEREGLRWADGKFTWRKTADKTVVNWESLATGLLNDIKDPEIRETLLGLHTTKVEGYRRIWFGCRGFREKAAA